MISSGGMPSSHSATVTALAVAIGLEEGAGAPAFAIAVVLACVVSFLLIILFPLQMSLGTRPYAIRFLELQILPKLLDLELSNLLLGLSFTCTEYTKLQLCLVRKEILNLTSYPCEQSL